MRCSRPDCNGAAAALVAFEPGRRIAHLLPVDADAGAWAVCRRHAETLQPPRQWVLVDDRPEAPALFALPDAPVAAERAAVTPRRPRPDGPGGQPLPLETAAPEPAMTTAPALVDAQVETVTLWNGHFAPVSASEDLGGVLDAHTPLLRRAFRAARAG